jgi:hypothetical protein
MTVSIDIKIEQLKLKKTILSSKKNVVTLQSIITDVILKSNS